MGHRQQRPDLSKAQSERIHAMRSGEARYGLSLVEVIEAKQKIQSGGALFVRRQSNRVTVFDVPLANKTVRAVYDSRRHEIITFLLMDAEVSDV